MKRGKVQVQQEASLGRRLQSGLLYITFRLGEPKGQVLGVVGRIGVQSQMGDISWVELTWHWKLTELWGRWRGRAGHAACGEPACPGEGCRAPWGGGLPVQVRGAGPRGEAACLWRD